MQNQDFINELMGFNPSDLSAFQEPEKVNMNINVYKTNPTTLSKSEDGHYHSRVRVIYNPYDVRHSIVKQVNYAMRDADGFFLVRSSLADGNRECPIFKGWKKLWYGGDEKKEFAKQMFQRTESQWALVQIIEDDNQPELVGQFKAWKLPKDVFEKMQAKMNPSPDSKKAPVALMDYLFGPVLEIDVTPGPDDPKNPGRKQREISYSLCDFDTEVCPITRVDGTPLFEDAEIETIETYSAKKRALAKAKAEVVAAAGNSDAKKRETAKAKAEAKETAVQKEIDEMRDAIVALYGKAINYLKSDEANVFDLVKECSYQPWSPEVAARVERWLDAVVNMQDPAVSVTTQAAVPAQPEAETVAPTEPSPEGVGMEFMDEGMPF